MTTKKIEIEIPEHQEIDNINTINRKTTTDDTILIEVTLKDKEPPKPKWKNYTSIDDLPRPMNFFSENQVRIFIPASNYLSAAEQIYHFSNEIEASDFFNGLNKLLSKK